MTLPMILWGGAGIGILLSLLRDKSRTHKALKTSWKAFLSLLPVLMGMIAVVGFVLAILPPSLITKVFQMHDWMGYSLVAMVGTVITLPGPVAFPLAGTLLRHGAEYGLLATFITTLTMVGTVTAPAEIAHFGKRFTIVRQLVSFALAILIGITMRWLL